MTEPPVSPLSDHLSDDRNRIKDIQGVPDLPQIVNCLGGSMVEDLEQQLLSDIHILQALNEDHLRQCCNMILAYLKNPNEDELQSGLGNFTAFNGFSVPLLRSAVKGLFAIFRGAIQHETGPEQLGEDALALGLGEERGAVLEQVWREAWRDLLAGAAAKLAPFHHQLMDMQWKVGGVVATDEMSDAGDMFVQLRLALGGPGGGGQRETVSLDLSLPQFYQFVAEMEKAKAVLGHLDQQQGRGAQQAA